MAKGRRKPADDAAPFWQRKRLGDMTQAEWESLCDGCGLCCLNKIEDIDTGQFYFTNVACKLLDTDSCRCKNYAARKTIVPDCVKLSPRNIHKLKYMPKTCAYRRLAEGKDLPEWHPLVTGDPESVHRAGISARGRAIPEGEGIALEDHIVRWVRC